MTTIKLVTLAPKGLNTPIDRSWDEGPHRQVDASPGAVAGALARADSDAVLVLDSLVPTPDPDLLRRLLDGPADAWHAGLRLGLGGQPRLYDHVKPLWMFNAPLDPSIEATSWRLSLRAALVRTTVLEQLGGPDRDFETLSGASLELGLRWILGGALLRHVPDLVPIGTPHDNLPTAADELRLIHRHRGRLWAGWALQRAVVTRDMSLATAMRLLPRLREAPSEPVPHYQPPPRPPGDADRTVSVILPTIDRYPYLVPLLHQLAAQTSPPHQVLIVDQTPIQQRRSDLADVEPDLPVTVFAQDEPGQSTARNVALRAATGEFVLFVDDDDEIEPDLLAGHLQRLTDGVDACSGGVDDATAGPPPVGFRHRRANDNFPTNNTMLRRSALRLSGLFDPSFDHGPRADHDLGMRLHLAGAVLVYDPAVLVFHHHAPAGGLRTHGARAITAASARRSLRQRNLPSMTQLYLGYRYFTADQRREGRAITLLSALSGDGPPFRRVGRAATQALLLPSTLRHQRRTRCSAKRQWVNRPPIPTLDGP